MKEHARFERLWKSPAAAAELGREDTRMQEVAQGSFRHAEEFTTDSECRQVVLKRRGGGSDFSV